MTVLTAVFATAVRASEQATVVVAFADGRTETRRMELEPAGEHVLRWRLDRRTLTAPVSFIRVTPDFASARAGEDGWFLAGDGTRGHFRPTAVNTNKLWEASYQVLPVYGMKTPRTTFLAIATGMRFHAGVDYVVTSGVYTVSFTFHEDMYDLYEDPTIEYRLFDDPKADYNEMAHAYRDFQKAKGRLVSLKDRAAKRPALAYAAKAPEIRIRQAWKPVPATISRQVPENEPPVTPYVTFARVAELARRLKRADVENAQFCLVGWNRGGHDGAYPQLFPVEPTLGGETALRDCIRTVQDLGYQIVAHGNYNDAYLLADSFDLEFVKEKDSTGRVVWPKETWGGGGKFTMCPQRAYEKFAVRDAARVAALGFKGVYYLDVLTCAVPPACRDVRHPLTRAGIVQWFNAILDLQTETFGGVASEGACDAYVGHFDSVLTVCWGNPFPKEAPTSFFDDYVPFWEIVYHGFLLYTPFRNIMNATANPDERFMLKLAEYDGRPTFYVHSRFKADNNASMGACDLRATTDEELDETVRCIAKGAAEYAARAALQYETMERHAEIAPNVYRTTFSNGSSIIVDYTSLSVSYPTRGEFDKICGRLGKEKEK